MADRPAVTSRRFVTRDKLMAAFSGSHEVAVAFENLQHDVSTILPDASQESGTTADQALANAAAAQASANAAQADANALKLPSYVVLGASATLANERTFAVGQGLKITDGGGGGLVTLDRSDLVSILGVDATDATGIFVDAVGLALALVANATYLVDGLLTFQSAAVTTGLALGFTLPAGASIAGAYGHNTTATAIEGSYNNAAGAVGGNTSAAAVAAANLPITGRWMIATGATPGVAQLQFRTEVAASAVTLKAALSALIATRLA